MEKAHAQQFLDADANADQSSRSSDAVVVEYNNTPVKQDNGILSRLRNLEARMDKKLGIESQAIERKLPEDRHPMSWHSQAPMFCLWASGTMGLSCFATGFLGWEFGITLGQVIPLIIFGAIFGASITGFCATLGAPTGLRQISVSRYSMGWYPNKIIAALNTITQLGWAAVSCITGGLALQGVSNGSISIAVGIVIIACISFAVSFVGLRAILIYEKYAWIIFFIIFLIIYGQTGKYANELLPPAENGVALSGQALSGTVLTLLAIYYGSSASWCSMASDYYVHYPVNVNRWKVFFMTTFGIAIPTSFGMIAGACVASAFTIKPEWADAEQRGLGFLIVKMLHPRGFADFLLVVFIFSGINTNIISLYSSAISCQQFARPCMRVPRFIWTILCFGVMLALGLAGGNHLLTYLQDFLSLLGYWCTSYFTIVFTEHVVFRKGDFANYNLEGWNDPNVLPHGIAAASAFAMGVVAWVLGMNETWFVGPLSALIGPFGGDVGNEFTLIVTLLTFLPIRYWELKRFGK